MPWAWRMALLNMVRKLEPGLSPCVQLIEDSVCWGCLHMTYEREGSKGEGSAN